MPARFACLLALVLPAVAQAGFPEDVTPSSMTDQGGVRVVDTALLGDAYARMIRELGAAIDGSTLFPARTLGASGFEMVVDTNVAFTDTKNGDGTASTFERVTPDESPTSVFFAPGLTMRKGLPLSMEIGATARWVGMSRQGVFGGFLHAGLLENFEPWPDLGLHIGYTGYIGNDELELGVFDAGLTLGGSFRPGVKDRLRAVEVSPFGDASLQVVTATTTLDAETVATIGAVTFGKRGGDPATNSKAIVMPRFSGGLQIRAAHLVIRFSGSYSLKSVPSVGAAIGYTY